MTRERRGAVVGRKGGRRVEGRREAGRREEEGKEGRDEAGRKITPPIPHS